MFLFIGFPGGFNRERWRLFRSFDPTIVAHKVAAKQGEICLRVKLNRLAYFFDDYL